MTDVVVPGVGTLTFPDGMSQQDMAAAIQRNYPQIHGHNADAEAEDPLSGMSGTDKLLAGMGKSFNDMYMGGKELIAKAGSAVGVPGADNMLQQTQQDVATARDTDKHLMTSGAAQAGNILGDMAVGLLAPEGLAGAAVGGAAMGALTPTTQGESGLENTALGAAGGVAGQALGTLAGKALGRVIQPLRNVGSPQADAQVTTLLSQGVPLDLAQQTGGGKLATTIKNIVADNPYIGDAGYGQAQKEAFTGAVLKHIGLSSNTADPAAMMAAKINLGSTFDALAARNPINVDQTLLNHLAVIQHQASKEVPEGYRAVIDSKIDDIIDLGAAGNGSLSGQAFNNLRTSLGRLQSVQDPITAHWAGTIEEALHDAMGRSMAPADQQLLSATRGQYRMMKTIQEAIGPDDLISPSKLWTAVDKAKNTNQVVFGQGPQALVQLAQAGKNVIGSLNTANSGTAQRTAGLATIAGLLGAVDGYQQGHGDPSTIVKYGLGAFAAPQVARAIVQNPKMAAIAAGWAKSKILSGFRQTVQDIGKGAGQRAGMAVVPNADALSGDLNSSQTPEQQP